MSQTPSQLLPLLLLYVGVGFACCFVRSATAAQALRGHVLAAAAQAEGVHAFGPVGQGALLTALGVDARAAALARAAPDRADSIAADRERLTVAMGVLFKALAVTAPGWPAPAGFQ